MALGQIDDEKYFSMLLRPVDEPLVDDVCFPDFPGPEIQKQFVGPSCQDALRAAYQFFRLIEGYATALGKPFSYDNFNFLDFGFGWGKYFNIIKYIDDGSFWQAVLVVQRKQVCP